MLIVVWEVQQLVEGAQANLAGALTGMGQRTLPMVLTVTVFNNATTGTILIEHGQAAWDDRLT